LISAEATNAEASLRATSTTTEHHDHTALIEEACPNCGALLTRHYCAECGQRRIDHHEWLVGHFLHHLAHEIVHLDGKIFRTILALLFRPGVLTADHLAGRRGGYVNPIRVYLTAGALFFFFGATAFLAASGVRQTEMNRVLAPAAARQNVAPEVLYEKFKAKLKTALPLLRAASVIVAALFLAGLYYGARRYYVEHLIFALHFFAFDFALTSLSAIPIQWFDLRAENSSYWLLGVPSMVLLLVYAIVALRRVYRQGWGRTITKGVTFFVLFIGLQMFVYVIALFAAVTLTLKS